MSGGKPVNSALKGEHVMSERSGAITLQGNPMTLVGNQVKVGDKAPGFTLAANDLSPVSLDDFKGKVVIIASVPSLDTPVCDIETKRFNKEAAALGDVAILTVSVDLPFAQARWCGAAGVDAVKTLSDYKDVAFGEAYGVLIKELRLLARAVFVVDKQGVVQYAETVKEVADEPDYESVLAAAKKLA